MPPAIDRPHSQSPRDPDRTIWRRFYGINGRRIEVKRFLGGLGGGRNLCPERQESRREPQLEY